VQIEEKPHYLARPKGAREMRRMDVSKRVSMGVPAAETEIESADARIMVIDDHDLEYCVSCYQKKSVFEKPYFFMMRPKFDAICNGLPLSQRLI
jgi:hypothetical protein